MKRIHELKSASILTAAMVLLLCPGCSIKRMAINKVGDALAGGGTVFAADDDPELVRAAVPFSLKLMESLLAQSPEHEGLLLATSSGFTQYGYGFVQQEADELEEKDLAAALEMRQRARRLYLRARDYALRGLELAHPGFTNRLRSEAREAVDVLRKGDVPLAYWAAASWGAAIGVIKDNTDLIAELPLVEALADRALELDESYGQGALHSFLISYEMVRPGPRAEAARRARAHFERVVELTDGQHAGAYVSLAESVAVSQQDRKEFEALLNQALAINVNTKPEWRLVNLIIQRRARWLLSHADNFVEPETDAEHQSLTTLK